MFGLFSFLLISCFSVLAEDKHFVIDVCSYNNKNWHKQNLDSIFSQTYKKFHVFYTNDFSSDKTGKSVAKYIKKNGLEKYITLINNNQRQRMLSNHWRVIHQSDPSEIIIHLDGDDMFAHDKVLEQLNEIYQDENIWMTVGSYRFWPRGDQYIVEEIPRSVVNNGTYRKSNFKKSPYHPRTFYAWLAQHIKLEDLLYYRKPFEDQFIPAISDWSLMYPLFEMAAGKYCIIPNILYQFNVVNPLNHDKDQKTLRLQHDCAAFICRKRPYKQLQHKKIINTKKDDPIDILVLGDNSESAIRKIQQNIKGYRNIIQFQSSDLTYCSDYVCCINGLDVPEEIIDLCVYKNMLERTHTRIFLMISANNPLKTCWLMDDTYAFIAKMHTIPQSNLFICKKQALFSIDKNIKISTLLSNIIDRNEVVLFSKNQIRDNDEE